jgi:hypothetical protein
MGDYIFSLIVVSPERKVLIPIRKKVADYFGVEPCLDITTTIRRKAYTYTRYSSVQIGTGVIVSVGQERFTLPAAVRKRGRKIRLPTEIMSMKGNIRTLGIAFPQKAHHIAIAHWIYHNCKQHRPWYFLSPAGKKVRVMDCSYYWEWQSRAKE